MVEYFGGSDGFSGRLLQRMVPGVAHVLHAPSPVMAFSNADSVLAFVFGLFFFLIYFFFTVYLCDAQILQYCLLA